MTDLLSPPGPARDESLTGTGQPTGLKPVLEIVPDAEVRRVPRPKGRPRYPSVSIPTAVKTRGLTMPQPPHSIHPSLPQVRQAREASPTEAPRHTKYSRSTSALGSVNGK